MSKLKFRAWLPDRKIDYGQQGKGNYYYQEDQYLQSFFRRICNHYYEAHPAHLPFEIEDRLEQFSTWTDSEDTDIYAGDIVYIAGTGNVEMKFPFHELYEAAMENNIGKIVGNIKENPELLEDDDY